MIGGCLETQFKSFSIRIRTRDWNREAACAFSLPIKPLKKFQIQFNLVDRKNAADNSMHD
jgi:hypothetical protein